MVRKHAKDIPKKNIPEKESPDSNFNVLGVIIFSSMNSNCFSIFVYSSHFGFCINSFDFLTNGVPV